MGDEPVEQQEHPKEEKKNRKQRRAEKSKKGGDSQSSYGQSGNVGPNEGGPKQRARRRQ